MCNGGADFHLFTIPKKLTTFFGHHLIFRPSCFYSHATTTSSYSLVPSPPAGSIASEQSAIFRPKGGRPPYPRLKLKYIEVNRKWRKNLITLKRPPSYLALYERTSHFHDKKAHAYQSLHLVNEMETSIIKAAHKAYVHSTLNRQSERRLKPTILQLLTKTILAS